MANEIGVTREDVALLVAALHEMHASAERLLESMTIDEKNDHDGDTLPGNEAPEPPDDLAVLKEMAKGPHVEGRDFHEMAPDLPSHPRFVERYDGEPPWMRDRTPCACGHERDVHGSLSGDAGPVVCHVVDCACKGFNPEKTQA